MFAIIGKKKSLNKQELIEMLISLGCKEPKPVVDQIAKVGGALVNNMRIMYVR